MKGDPTIKDVKKAKTDLEMSIMKSIKDFESKYGVRLGYINIQRKRDTDENGFDRSEAVTENKKRAVTNVEINMDLDVIY